MGFLFYFFLAMQLCNNLESFVRCMDLLTVSLYVKEHV